MGGRIEAYIDVASYYSYIGFADLLANLELLKSHGVEVEFFPILIAGLNSLTGNSPPWKLPVKGAYLAKDGQRAARRVGKSHIKFPKDFLSMALTTSVERALLYIKAHYSTETFISATHYLMDKFWTPPHLNMTKDENLEIALKGATENVDGTGKKLFSDEDVKKIMAGREETKDLLKSETKRTADMGAFGLPWLRVTNDEGKTEPFFGSDRFHYVYQFLGIPYQDVKLLESAKL